MDDFLDASSLSNNGEALAQRRRAPKHGGQSSRGGRRVKRWPLARSQRRSLP